MESINTYIGASCMLIMLEAIWPSLKTYPNALPDSAGLQSNRMIAYFVFWTREFRAQFHAHALTPSPTTACHDPSAKDAMAVLYQVYRCCHCCFCAARLVHQHSWRGRTCLLPEIQVGRVRQILGLAVWTQHCHLWKDHACPQYCKSPVT